MALVGELSTVEAALADVAVTASTKASHLKSDLGVFDFSLSDDEMARLRRI